MSKVIAADLCPSIFCTALTFAPADTASDAAVCHRSCGVTRGNPGVAGSRCGATGGVATLLERHWPAVKAVTTELYIDGTVDDGAVCTALGLTDGGGPGSFQLANLRAGLHAVVRSGKHPSVRYTT